MKKMLDSYGLRVLAFLLCCAFGLAAIGCALGFMYVTYEPGMGPDDQRDFLNSELARNYAAQNAYNALESAGYALTQKPDERPVIYTDDGFSCVIRDKSGAVVADTRREESVPVSTVQSFSGMYSDGLTIESYVNLPTETNTELYGHILVYDTLYNLRTVFLPAGLAAGLLTLLLFVFLMAAAGRTPEGVKLGGFHRWPLELYLGALAGLIALCIYLMVETSYHEAMRNIVLFAVLYGLLILGAGACALLGCMTLAARFRGGKWWRNTVTFFCLKWAWVIFVFCWKWIWKALTWCWRGTKGVCRGIWTLLRALPLSWKSAAVYCAFVLINIIFSLNAVWNGEGFLVFLILFDTVGLLAVIWTAMQMRKLQSAGRALAAGDLSLTVDTKHMLPVFKEHAENLGAVSLGMTKAVNERMKSERFKTELITNVSHDLKTPLTSIVSYVDLLKAENIENERAREYIDVLDRQSQRLKKLTTDLVDASKASSGVLTVNKEQVDLGELLRQSAGEYAERFALAQLDPVVNVPEAETVVTADGRLLWRVLDNLLTNVVKYALPGTRVYMDLTRREDQTVISVKNISREALNIPAEELMERFVRGDASRSSDGSGLGLSIARSLTELMGGQLRLTLDGDLFKAEIIF